MKCFRRRSDEGDEDSLLSVNYGGFAPVLVEGLKELEQHQQLEVKRLRELARDQRIEIESLKALAREQMLEVEELKRWLRQLVHSQNHQQQNCKDKIDSVHSKLFELERRLQR